MRRMLIKELGKVITGNTPSMKNTEFYNSNDIGFVKPDIFENSRITHINSTNSFISEKARNKARIVKKDTVLITCIGSIGKVGIIEGAEYSFNQQINAIEPNNKVVAKYLAYNILSNKNRLMNIANAPVVPIINKTQFENFDIVINENIEEQKRIVKILDQTNKIITLRRNQLNELDKLIKSRFVEMFGGLELNSMNLPSIPMTEICEIIDGDRGKNYPSQDEFSDEGHCLFLNAKNVTRNGFSFENCMFVTKEKDEILSKGHLKRGDVVLTTRGTIGNLAIYDDSVPFDNVRINSGMVILRMNHDIVSEHFFIEQFKMQLTSIKEKIASGSAQPQLPISTMNKIMVLMPNVNEQKQFASFVKQVDKSKFAIQKSLNETQKLFDSLMQEYFG